MSICDLPDDEGLFAQALIKDNMPDLISEQDCVPPKAALHCANAPKVDIPSGPQPLPQSLYMQALFSILYIGTHTDGQNAPGVYVHDCDVAGFPEFIPQLLSSVHAFVCTPDKGQVDGDHDVHDQSGTHIFPHLLFAHVYVPSKHWALV